MTKRERRHNEHKKDSRYGLISYIGVFLAMLLLSSMLFLLYTEQYTVVEFAFSILFSSIVSVLVRVYQLDSMYFASEKEEESRRVSDMMERMDERLKKESKLIQEKRVARQEKIDRSSRLASMDSSQQEPTIRRHPKKPIPGLSRGISEVRPLEKDHLVRVLRGGEFVGNRMRFKVKVLNDSEFIISDVTVYLLSYPSDALRISEDDHHIFFSKIEPGGFRSPTFDFMPTQDCVRGDIVAGVSYMDMRGNPHTLTTKPFVIRAVCDLLIPQQVTPEVFQLKLKELECGEIVIKIKEWTPTEMFDKALKIVDESNFFEVSSKTEEKDEVFFGTIVGFAKGKYTGKNVGVEISITGQMGAKGASCTIQVSGEDQAMILPAIDDLRERLSAWLCPMCSSPLTLANVEDLRKGEVVECPFCGVSIGR